VVEADVISYLNRGVYVPTKGATKQITSAQLAPKRFLANAVYNFADADSTPSVAKGNFFKTANTGATTITMFDDGLDGQFIFVVLDGNTTIDFTGTNLKGNTGADLTDAQGAFLFGVFDGSNWNCITGR
jgi:hypothetical protein